MSTQVQRWRRMRVQRWRRMQLRVEEDAAQGGSSEEQRWVAAYSPLGGEVATLHEETGGGLAADESEHLQTENTVILSSTQHTI